MKVNLDNYTVKEVGGKLLASPPSELPDFSIYTAAMTADPTRDLLVNMTGSSTEQDLQGDVMDVQALQTMTKVTPGLAIWLNHDYTLPDSLFGSLAAAPIIRQQSGVADLDISVDVEPTSENAMKTYSYIKRGKVRLGCSIGCKVLKYEFLEDQIDPDDPMSLFFIPMRILAVKTLEWSVVGIPANQRSWVENAARGIFQRTLDPRLAPTVKTLFPRDYERIVARVDDRDQREELANTPARALPQRRLAWQPSTRTFILESMSGDEPVLAARVSELLGQLAKEAADVNKKKQNGVDDVDEVVAPVIEADAEPTVEANIEPDLEKGASGSSDWPLTDRDVAWDNGESTSEIEKWAAGADGKLDPAKLKSVHFWFDPKEPGENIGSYKMLFCDVIGGDVKAVPKGIFACAAVMQGSHGNKPDIPAGDVAGVQARIAAWYEKMAKEFKDPTIVAPWKQEEGKSEEPDKLASEEPAVETPAAVEEPIVETPAASEEPIAKAVELPIPGTIEDPERAAVLLAYNTLGKRLGFAEVVDNQKAAGGVDITNMDLGDVIRFAHRLDDIADINAGLTDDLLHALGQPDSDDMAGTPDGSSASLQSGEQAVSMLRAMFAIRFKAGARHSAADMESIQSIHDACMSLTDGAVCQKGVRTPSDNPNQSDNEPDDNDNDVDGTMAAVVPLVKELGQLREAFGNINVKAVETEVVKAMTQLADISKQLEERSAQLQQAVEDARRAKEDALKAAEYSREATETVSKLKDMPLGRPTGHMGRTVKATDAAVNFDEMMKLAGAQTPDETEDVLGTALKQTTVTYVKGVGKVRHWPEGVGKGVRPKLSNEQKIVMSASDISSYLEGGESSVPEID